MLVKESKFYYIIKKMDYCRQSNSNIYWKE